MAYWITSLKYTPTYLQCLNLLLRMCSYHKHLETYSGIFTNYYIIAITYMTILWVVWWKGSCIFSQKGSGIYIIIVQARLKIPV